MSKPQTIESAGKSEILFLSVYYSTGRIQLYTRLLEKLTEAFTPAVWSLSVSAKTFPFESANSRSRRRNFFGYPSKGAK